MSKLMLNYSKKGIKSLGKLLKRLLDKAETGLSGLPRER